VLRPFERSVSGPASRTGAACLMVALVASGCTTPDPTALLSVNDVETYWAVDPPIGGTQYLAPAVRFRVRSRSEKAQTSVQAQAVFRRKGEGESWGSDYTQAASRQKPLAAGQEFEVLLKSDARYTSGGPPEGMFSNAAFRDATVDVFLRVGASPWVKFATVDVERHIGSRAAQQIVNTPADGPPIPTPSRRP
jgi:hypothetical protein